MAEVVKTGFGVALVGVDATLKALRTVAPDLNKELRAELKRIGNELVADAKRFVPATPPMSRMARTPKDPVGWAKARGRTPSRGGAGWPAWDSGKIAAGITSSTSKPRGVKTGALLYILNKDPMGAIYEVAGRRSSGAPGTAGPKFIRRLNADDTASRIIWRAYDEGGANDVKGAVIRAVESAEKALAERYGDGGYVYQER